MPRQPPWQYVNYCLRRLPCLSANILALAPIPRIPSRLSEGTYTVRVSLKGNYSGTLSFALEVTKADEPVDPDESVDPDEPVDPDKPVDPDEPVDPETPAEPSEPSGFPGWAIAVIVCGSLLAIAAVIAIVVVAKKKGKKGDAEGR